MWHDIIHGIKHGKKKVQLAPSRSRAEKANKIQKFQDENGKIQIVIQEGGKNIPITYNALNPSSGELPKTLTLSEE